MQNNTSMFWTSMTMETSKSLHFRNSKITSNCSNSAEGSRTSTNFIEPLLPKN